MESPITTEPDKAAGFCTAMELIIEEVSELEFCAGWKRDIEFDLYRRAVLDPSDDDPSLKHMIALKVLHEASGGWIAWADGPRFVPAEEWHLIYEAWCAKGEQ